MRPEKLLISALILGSSVVVAGPGTSAVAAGGFVPTPIPLRAQDVRDIGVTDVDLDGNLDVFTVNHSDRENILAGRGDGTFRQRIEAWRLTQDHRFPGLMYAATELPPPPADSVHIVWRKTVQQERLILRFPGSRVAGSLSMISRIVVAASGPIRHAKSIRELPSGVRSTLVRFVSDGTSKLVINVRDIGTPITVRMKTVADIRVGIPPVRAPETFQLFRRDRHGAAWADIEGGPRPEVAYVRGGMKGKALDYPVNLFQELRTYEQDGYPDFGVDAGFAQDGCSSQAVEWVDANSDGQLDLYVACNHHQPNRLYIQDQGRFSEEADARGIAESLDPVVWIDADDDGDSDLVTVLYGQVVIYDNDDGYFSRQEILEVPARGVRNLAVLPTSQGTELSVFANSGSGTVRLDADGAPSWTDFGDLGLPTDMLHGSWVDYDNDADLDLFTVPGGLYAQLLPGVFALAPDQPPIPDGSIQSVRIAWFDADNDGRLDFLGAFLPEKVFPLRWKVSYALNRVNTGNHYLALDLRGAEGNRSAIGAVVVASTGLGSVTTRVGAFETSRNSQGHHRIYLGLGASNGAVHLRVQWPDGTVDEIDVGTVDRRMTVRQG